MRLDEAKVILEENGYELLEEGKLGRALGIGALALGNLFGTAHAEIDNLDLKTIDTEEINEIKTALEQEKDIDFCKVKSKGLVCKDTNNSVTFYPTETLENIGISDNITEIIFLDGYKNENKLSGIIFNYKNGSKKLITHKIGDKYGYITKLDEYDTETDKKMITPGKVEEMTNHLYKTLTKEVDRPNKYEEIEQKILKKYTGKDTDKYKNYKQYEDEELSDDDNSHLNRIMAKYQK